MHQMFSVHTTPEKFENEGFSLKMHQMFSVHTTTEFIKNATTTSNFAFVVEEIEISSGKSLLFTIAISTFRFQNDFRPRLLTQNHRFQNPPGWKAPFRSALLRTVRQTGGNKILQGALHYRECLFRILMNKNTSSCPMIFISNVSTHFLFLAEHISILSNEKPSAAPRQFTQFFESLSY